MFGWTGTPFAFSIFSRLLEGCIEHDIEGGLKVYVDILCGCSGVPHAEKDQLIAEKDQLISTRKTFSRTEYEYAWMVH